MIAIKSENVKRNIQATELHQHFQTDTSLAIEAMLKIFDNIAIGQQFFFIAKKLLDFFK